MKKNMLYTFDVFDTIITRRTATPKGIFACIQAELLENKRYAVIPMYIKCNFYHLRIQAEKLARKCYRANEIEDITLEQIYEALATTGNLTADEMKQLMDLEKTTEYENIIGIQENIDKVKLLVAKGQRVAFISDMYLDYHIIKKLLMKVEHSFEHIPLYVSSEYKKGKYTKNLYKLVQKAENANFQQWVHYGDNVNADVQMAKKLGIQAEQFDFPPLLEHEEKILEQKPEDAFIQLTIGAARNARLEHHLSGAGEIGASIGGVILFPYVWWVLQESLRKRIRRLYFIARDGYVLKEISDVIIKECQYEIETYYIYGSRRAWRMPSFSEQNDDVYKFVQWSHPGKIKNIKGLAEIFQISVEELIRFLPPIYQEETTHLTQYALQVLVRLLNQDISFKQYLIEVHKEKREHAISYLKQEINVTEDAFAFVELSGGGFTQGCLAELMREIHDQPIRTFFYKMDQLHVMKNCVYYNFMPSALYLTLIIEMLCRAPHGQTYGYKEENHKIVPVLKGDEGTAIVAHGFYDYLSGVKYFTQNYMRAIQQSSSTQVNRLDLVLRYMEYVTKTPDKETLDFFADMPNSESGREKTVVAFAPRLSKREIRDLFLLHAGESREKYYKGSSLEYSLLRCSASDKKRIQFYQTKRKEIIARFERLAKLRLPGGYSLAEDFPLELLSGKIVLYAAGNLGQGLYQRIQTLENVEVVQWVDQDYERYQKEGLPVFGIHTIGQIAYDQLVIAVLNKDAAHEIKEVLIKKGIPDKKIVWVNIRESWL